MNQESFNPFGLLKRDEATPIPKIVGSWEAIFKTPDETNENYDRLIDLRGGIAEVKAASKPSQAASAVPKVGLMLLSYPTLVLIMACEAIQSYTEYCVYSCADVILFCLVAPIKHFKEIFKVSIRTPKGSSARDQSIFMPQLSVLPFTSPQRGGINRWLNTVI